MSSRQRKRFSLSRARGRAGVGAAPRKAPVAGSMRAPSSPAHLLGDEISAAPSLNEVPPPQPSPACGRGGMPPSTQLIDSIDQGNFYRFRSGPQTTPLAIRSSISPVEYPNSVSTEVACSLNFGGTLRRLGLLRASRIGEATPLYQSFPMTSPRWTAWALVSALSIDCTGPAGNPAASSRSHSGSASCWLNTAASSARSASRLAMRSLLRAKRGSVPSSGLPISLQSLRKVPSLPTPMKILSVRGREDRIGHEIGVLV